MPAYPATFTRAVSQVVVVHSWSDRVHLWPWVVLALSCVLGRICGTQVLTSYLSCTLTPLRNWGSALYPPQI